MSFLKWVSKAIITNNVESVLSFPHKLLDKQEFGLIKFLTDYNEKFGSLPPVETVLREVDNSDLLVDTRVKPDSVIEQLFSEAKRENYARKSREILTSALSKNADEYLVAIKEIEQLEKLVRPASKPKLYDDLTIYEKPKTKVSFKYKHLENASNSLLGGEVCIFVGAAKSKKTWMLLDLALDAYVRQQKKVYFTSLEMSAIQIQQRINALVGGFDPSVFRVGSDDELKESQEKFIERNKKIKEKTSGTIIIPEKMTNTVWDVIRDIEEYEPEVVYLDSIYLFKDARGIPIQSNWGEIATTIALIKSIAREKGIQVICNSQLKKDAKDDVEAADVAFSHALVQTCDLIVSVQADEGNTLSERSLLKILASRNGGAGHIGYITFDWNICLIQEHFSKVVLEGMKSD